MPDRFSADLVITKHTQAPISGMNNTEILRLGVGAASESEAIRMVQTLLNAHTAGNAPANAD